MSGRRGVGRRGLIGGASMLILMAAETGVAKAEELDGDLMRLCRQFVTQENELDRISDELGEMDYKDRDAHPLALLERQGVDRIHELRNLISDIPARTPEGIRAKAQAALADFGREDDWPEDNSYWIVWTLARDILGKDA